MDVKAQYPDAIVFFRLGDFYETFDEDAELAARELDLVLTSRPQGKNQRTPMAGVPYHAAENYIARLIAKGYKVALCEQMGSQPVNGLMPREVVRVFTSGTVVEPGMLEAGRNNFLAAVVPGSKGTGLAYVDVSTGEFATTELDGYRKLDEELARLAPAELLVPEDAVAPLAPSATLTRLPEWRFEEGYSYQTLTRHFGVSSLAAFGCEGKSLATRAAGAILYYLQETQRGTLGQIQRLATYDTGDYMALDMATRRNLELTESLLGGRKGSLLAVIDRTITAMGARLLHQQITRPLLVIDRIEGRLNSVEEFVATPLLRAEARRLLKNTSDLERLTNRMLSGRASPRDVEHIALSLKLVPELRALVSEQRALKRLASQLEDCSDVVELISRSIAENAPANLNKMGVIRSGYSAELDGMMNSTAHARNWVAELEPRERQRTGISSLKVGFNKVFGYYIEVTRANSERVPEDYIRKQTLTNAERFITPELKEYETLILNAEERILEAEQRLFEEVCAEASQASDRLLATARVLARLDVAAGLAETAAQRGFVRPTFADDDSMAIAEGRHPVVEQAMLSLPAGGQRFVPNDVVFGDQERILIITGPNMSGKSTYLRQVALIVLLAQIGSYVPAAKARIGLVDRIFTRIGAHDELQAGRSTFMVEMVETAEILNHASGTSLLILDEIGRGTSTYDGLSLAWAIVEYLHNHPRLLPRTLFATHYHELTGLADLLPHVANYSVGVAEEGDDVVFLHRIVPGGADRSYGIQVAQLAGLPRDVVNRATDILRDLERQAPTAAVRPSRLSASQQMALFPEASPLLDEVAALEVDSLTPLEAINKLYEWQRRYVRNDGEREDGRE